MTAAPSTRPLKLAFVSDTVYPYNKGGKEVRLHEITRRLVSPHHEVHVYTMKWWNGPRTIAQDGVYLHAISPLYPLYAHNRRSIRQALLFGLATFKLIGARFDILDVDHMPFYPLFSARIVTWLRRKPLIATWHEVWGRRYWLDYLQGPIGLVGHLTERLAFLLPDKIISNSLHTTARLQAAGVTKPITTIPLGVNLQDMIDVQAHPQPTDIVFVGRLLDHKNLDTLIRAIAQIKTVRPTIQARIIGDGPERSNLQQLVTNLELTNNIQLIGFVEQKTDLYRHIKAAQVFVLPSLREGFSLVVIEAHAAGVPVVAIRHPDNAATDLIHHGINGYIADNNPTDLAAKILAAIDNRPTLDPSFNIEQYNWQTVAHNVKEALAL